MKTLGLWSCRKKKTQILTGVGSMDPIDTLMQEDAVLEGCQGLPHIHCVWPSSDCCRLWCQINGIRMGEWSHTTDLLPSNRRAKVCKVLINYLQTKERVLHSTAWKRKAELKFRVKVLSKALFPTARGTLDKEVKENFKNSKPPHLERRWLWGK